MLRFVFRTRLRHRVQVLLQLVFELWVDQPDRGDGRQIQVQHFAGFTQQSHLFANRRSIILGSALNGACADNRPTDRAVRLQFDCRALDAIQESAQHHLIGDRERVFAQSFFQRFVRIVAYPGDFCRSSHLP